MIKITAAIRRQLRSYRFSRYSYAEKVGAAKKKRRNSQIPSGTKRICPNATAIIVNPKL